MDRVFFFFPRGAPYLRGRGKKTAPKLSNEHDVKQVLCKLHAPSDDTISNDAGFIKLIVKQASDIRMASSAISNGEVPMLNFMPNSTWLL